MADIVSVGAGPSGGFSAAQTAAPYTKYILTTRYRWDNGQVSLPVAYTQGQQVQAANQSPGAQPLQQRQKAVTIQATAPYGRKVVIFDIIRKGLPPVAPNPTPSNPNEVLEYADVQPFAPILNADGATYSYRITGEYSYTLLAPYWTTDGFSAGSTPADQSTPAQNTVTSSSFSQSLL